MGGLMGMHCVQPAMGFKVVLSFIGGPSFQRFVRLSPSVVVVFVLVVVVVVDKSLSATRRRDITCIFALTIWH